jgi:hypothetical protein
MPDFSTFSANSPRMSPQTGMGRYGHNPLPSRGLLQCQLDAVADEPDDSPCKRLGFAKPNEQISVRLLH